MAQKLVLVTVYGGDHRQHIACWQDFRPWSPQFRYHHVEDVDLLFESLSGRLRVEEIKEYVEGKITALCLGVGPDAVQGLGHTGCRHLSGSPPLSGYCRLALTFSLEDHPLQINCSWRHFGGFHSRTHRRRFGLFGDVRSATENKEWFDLGRGVGDVLDARYLQDKAIRFGGLEEYLLGVGARGLWLGTWSTAQGITYHAYSHEDRKHGVGASPAQAVLALEQSTRKDDEEIPF